MTEYMIVPKALITHAQEMREGGEPTDWDSCLRDIIESAKPVSAEPVAIAENLPDTGSAYSVKYLAQLPTGETKLYAAPQPAQQWIKCSEVELNAQT